MPLTKLTMPDGSPIPAGASAADLDTVDQIPVKYRDPEITPFKVDVKDSGGTFDFEIQSE